MKLEWVELMGGAGQSIPRRDPVRINIHLKGGVLI